MNDNKPETRKEYSSPKLTIYGDVRSITRNVGSKGVLDNLGGAAAGPKTA